MFNISTMCWTLGAADTLVNKTISPAHLELIF